MFKNYILKEIQQFNFGKELDAEQKAQILNSLIEFYDEDKLIGLSINDQIEIKKLFKQIKLMERDSKIGSFPQ